VEAALGRAAGTAGLVVSGDAGPGGEARGSPDSGGPAAQGNLLLSYSMWRSFTNDFTKGELLLQAIQIVDQLKLQEFSGMYFKAHKLLEPYVPRSHCPA
jgi:hypothetical protein